MHRCSGEHTQVQVWLELVRLRTESGQRDLQACAPAVGSKDKPRAKPERAEKQCFDEGVFRELGKADTDLESESQQMSLDSLRAQNRTIEEYVVRLVRQRDELKQLVKIAEEYDAYLILGLDGPTATEDEVKRAYRNLARKEHPDKAGTGNKRRFQQIQHAYKSVLQQMSAGGATSSTAPAAVDGMQKRGTGTQAHSTTVVEAARAAARGMDAADRVAVCAHQALVGSEQITEAAGLPKRRALCALHWSTRRGAAELRAAAQQLRLFSEAVGSVVRCAEDAMAEHQELISISVAGIGLRDRIAIVKDAGSSGLQSAELLEKICEATEATLRKADRMMPDGGAAAGPPSRGSRVDEPANFQRLGARVFAESLTRIAAAALRCASETFTDATKALELSSNLAVLELEARKERERRATKQQGFDEDDDPVAAPDRDEQAPGDQQADRPRCQDPQQGAEEPRAAAEGPRTGCPDAAAAPGHAATSKGDQLKSAARRVKERHVALRVKNLNFLSGLNDEALRMQARLKALLKRSEGALLPAISVAQKGSLFDLVKQLLYFALTETAKLAAGQAAAPPRVLERSLSFGLALQHGEGIAMPSDSRTQALRLAAMVDADLLCQLIDGPFKDGLLAVSAKRTAVADRGAPYMQTYGRGKSASAAPGGSGAPKAWEDAVHACCGRIVEGIRHSVAPAEA
mmetsp:Transcript_12619/g.35733  ORF Transcript_12619/g.35733 Transcript_12619/m.35733 type:complete len:689 (+) Transcript_12619:28-2094(+)